MADTWAQDAMATLWEEVVEATDLNATLSKDLDTFDFSDLDGERSDDTTHIPMELRYEVQDGYVSVEGDIQDNIERLIPVNRDKSKRVLTSISTKALRDPAKRAKAAKGMARELRNAIDITCYQTMINEASLVISSASAFDYADPIDAELLMLNNGLGGFDKKLFLSNKHYGNVAKDLGQNQYYGKDGIPADALTKAKLPMLATFDTMRSDYLINLPANATTGLAINGDQSHTVATYDSNDFYLDNRSMTLAITGVTDGNFPVGTKFTITGVNALNPETREDSGDLQTFTVKAVNGAGSSIVQPSIVIDGPYKNCSAQAADAAAISIINIASSNPTLFYTPESTCIVPGRLPVPADAGSVNVVEATTEQGLPMRMTYTYDFHNEVFKMKALVFFDVQVVQPSMLGVILDNQT